ncbi:hypothetical protein LUX12_22010 [Streptomyces somaliensis]|uniref:hypothetical protein n=1 Tax=Streptomyces somaliensis TaxID=78355 RepID=UPI0020CB6C28|nr:hypothetical protein [Streptomyces somaliensis]MCP9946877.1 hypothetical protein [Streptomyces somaliensis]MCP9963515.1 hypothetical protein [Streptomyces somaliensis]
MVPVVPGAVPVRLLVPSPCPAAPPSDPCPGELPIAGALVREGGVVLGVVMGLVLLLVLHDRGRTPRGPN